MQGLSQLELLKESVSELEPEFGADNPFVKGLKAQIAMLEKPRSENPMAQMDRLSLGFSNLESSSRPLQAQPEAGSTQAG